MASRGVAANRSTVGFVAAGAVFVVEEGVLAEVAVGVAVGVEAEGRVAIPYLPRGGGWSCGDLRDTLAAEYKGRRISNGPWDCHKFSLVLSRFILPDGDIEWGIKHGYYGYLDGSLIVGMAAVEAHFGKFMITSGYRCPIGNDGAGGKPDSHHVRGRAADFRRAGWTDEDKDSVIAWALSNAGARYGKRYGDRDHVHLDWN